MKIFTKITAVFLIIITFSCSEDKPYMSCFTPPQGFSFEIADAKTGENLFTNGTYKSNQIVITDSNSNNVIYQFVSENNINIIQLRTIGWKTEKINYQIKIGDKNIFTLYVDATRNSRECNYTTYNEITIKNAEFELNKSTGIYKIYVP